MFLTVQLLNVCVGIDEHALLPKTITGGGFAIINSPLDLNIKLQAHHEEEGGLYAGPCSWLFKCC